MESDREPPPVVRPLTAGGDPGGPDPGGTDPGGLCDAWRRRSLASGWLNAEDWDSEGVDAVVSAVCGTGELGAACDRLGRSRARAGIGIAETIDDLAALFAVLDHEPDEPDERGEPDGPGERGGPPLALVCAVAEGWAEEGMAQLSRGGCEDPLSGLATVSYLRTRLAELYREAAQDGTSPADSHCLLVITLPRRSDPWQRMALAIVVGHDLRVAFPGGETLSLARRNGVTGTERAIALVRAGDDLPMRCARLRRTIQGHPGAQIEMTLLPGLLPEALHLVDELTP
jgi:hypothetical protein